MRERQRLPKKPPQFGSAISDYELHDHRREQDFRSIGGNFPNFYRSASSADSVSQEVYSQLTFKDAGKWHQESFTAAEAIAWNDGGFDREDAVKSRARGLTPVKPE
jgi:hypothetical protein